MVTTAATPKTTVSARRKATASCMAHVTPQGSPLAVSPPRRLAVHMYFQLRCLPSATHLSVILRRSARVSGRFASVIHSMYSRWALGLNSAHATRALALFLSPAARSAGVGSAFFLGFRLGAALIPCSLRRIASLM